MENKKINLIVACTFDGGIGYDNKMPWTISEDLKKFKNITTRCNNREKKNAIIMGRNTWESLPKNPLVDRINIIITKKQYYIEQTENIRFFNNVNQALAYCNNNNLIESIYVIGGALLYNCFLQNSNLLSRISCIHLSVVYNIDYQVNKFIDIDTIYKKFILCKDYNYKSESNEKKFASYICYNKYLLKVN
jgi:dihydrofolate reductase